MSNSDKSNIKLTALQMRSDRPTAIASRAYGAGMEALGFNISLIAAKQPRLAIELLKLYDQAHSIQQDDPAAPHEDFELFTDALAKLMSGTSSETDRV